MWMSKDDGSVLLAIAVPYDGEKANHGNGTMKAIALSSQEEVVTMYNKAMEMGAKDDGEPGMRAGKFYGAYVYDLDGNKLCFFNFGD
jgi:predicted lactoylglutathione lyase